MRLGILGAAGITGRALLEPAAKVDGVEAWAVAARDPERATAYAAEHGIPRVFGTYAELLSEPSIDAVYVPLANSLHAEWAIAAVQAGKHVLCEKPLASNAEQAAEVVAAGAASGKLLVEAFHWRYHPVAERMLELGRAIAPLTEVEASFSVAIPSDDVRYDLELAGGALMDLGCYCVHMLRTLTGSEPTVLAAEAVEGPRGIDVSMTASLRFPPDIKASLHCSMVGETAWPQSMYLRARGENGQMEILNPMAPQWGNRITASLPDGVEIDETVDGPSTYEHQLRAFAAMVSGGATPLTGGDDSINNMVAIDAIYEASSLGRRA
jgi:predicted dehydrogenase